ncbi:outer membrane protein [Pelagovum pacificum]|uniref:Porin family protein n=1 Tax=Pelagovum pacificum TaxID=2588711 RepID=A0A5C5GDP9_9RHOB|nr:outer membrane beta-barrel protein [Pelagovum pacificum]QQA44803.1 outer membrane beta-barrel protein [Pelagovum pacificum]TNY32091.1 porin family protein [Pelagovum pacificum]
MKTIALATLAAFAAAPAFAAGLDDPAPMAPPAAPAPAPMMMSSDWSGFYGGASLGYGRVESDALADDTNGAVYGLHGGYMHDFGSIVAGGEIDYQATNIEDDTTGVELDSVSRAKLRLGYDAGNFLPYVTGGWAYAETSGTLEAEDSGSFAGIGIDYKVTDGIMVGGEVLQHQFDDFDDSGIDVDATTASARVSFQF